jgi:DegV family protein with EDD domain
MGRVAIITDSASDLTAADAAASGIRIVPLYVRFGVEEYRAGVELSSDEFWARMVAPDAPFPTTAAASPGDFQAAFEEELASGAEAIVCVTVGAKLSATLKSAELAAQALPGEEIHVVDSASASMGVGLLALLGAELAADGIPAAEIAATLRGRVGDIDLYVALDTLEYVRKGGRISPARAAIGTVLSIKPIITVIDGEVDTADRVRTRAKARERVIELLTSKPVERISILYTPPADADAAAFGREVLARLPGGVDPGHATTAVVGPSVGPHIGPGCLGAVVLLAR